MRFPPEIAQWLDEFGRKMLAGPQSGLGQTEIDRRMGDLYLDSQADPAGFATDLCTVVASDTGGFAAIGASRLLFDMFGPDYQTWPAGSLAILDAAIRNKQRRGLGPSMFTGYESKRLRSHTPV